MNKDNLPEKTVFVFDATEGMVLSKDVINSDGRLIAPASTVLTLDIISRISGYNILEISVYEKRKEAPHENVAYKEQMTYYEKVKDSDNFKNFSKTFLEGTNELESNLKNIVLNNSQIDTDSLLNNTSKILSECNNTLLAFDMLHCMRDIDDLTYVHSMNVAIIASVIGKWLKYSEDDIKVITLCGILHDIGKLLVPKEILTKPDRLTANEYAIMKEHVNLGYQIVKEADIDDRIKSAVLLHHEKCDGSGYPFGLKSSDISDFAKIITIADIYDAMTCNRIYRHAICPFSVIKSMEEDAFTKFDPAFIIPFLKNVASSYIGNNAKLSDGRTGEVVMINGHAIARPIIRCGNNEFVDLSKNPNIQITAII